MQVQAWFVTKASISWARKECGTYMWGKLVACSQEAMDPRLAEEHGHPYKDAAERCGAVKGKKKAMAKGGKKPIESKQACGSTNIRQDRRQKEKATGHHVRTNDEGREESKDFRRSIK